MPTYDYECRSCGHELEVFHAMSADPLTDCPSCGESALKRKIGLGAGLIFKGSGFYQTDYRSDSYKKGANADSGSPDTSSGSSNDSKKPAESKAPAAPKG